MKPICPLYYVLFMRELRAMTEDNYIFISSNKNTTTPFGAFPRIFDRLVLSGAETDK